MLDNEARADYGRHAIMTVARKTNVATVEPAATAVTDVLAYIAHFCDRLGLDPADMFDAGLHSYQGDSEDGPPAEHRLDPSNPLSDSEPHPAPSTRVLTVPDAVLEDLDALVQYTWADEQADYEMHAAENGEAQASTHIFESIRRLSAWAGEVRAAA
jgi:hypothetical protein